jgi:hypothetical protein
MLLIALGFAPRARAVTIYVTSTVQKVGSTGGCSLQEATYSANLHTNAAVDIVNADDAEHFTTTRCGTGNDTIIPPDRRYPKWPIPCFWAKRLGATLSGYGR